MIQKTPSNFCPSCFTGYSWQSSFLTATSYWGRQGGKVHILLTVPTSFSKSAPSQSTNWDVITLLISNSYQWYFLFLDCHHCCWINRQQGLSQCRQSLVEQFGRYYIRRRTKKSLSQENMDLKIQSTHNTAYSRFESIMLTWWVISLISIAFL